MTGDPVKMKQGSGKGAQSMHNGARPVHANIVTKKRSVF